MYREESIYKRQRKNSRENNKPAVFKFYRIVVICDTELFKNTKILNSPSPRSPGIGVGLFLVNPKDNTLLIGRRRDSNLFGLPGGWLELGESWEECASRELKEETGLIKSIYNFSHIHTLNCRIMSQKFHNISCIMYAEIEDHELDKIKNMEPHKCYGWEWVPLELLRKNLLRLFVPLRHFLAKFSNLENTSDLKKMVKRFQIISNE